MRLAAIFVLCFSLSPVLSIGRAGQQTSQQQTQTEPGASSSSQSQTQAAQPAANQPKPSAARHRHQKSSPPDCTNAPAALKPVGDSTEPAKAAGMEAPAAGSGATAPANTGTGQSGSPTPDPARSEQASPTPAKPCPPAKKVVRNGGAREPAIQLLPETTSAEQTEQQRAIDQLLAATEENLKKIADRQLTASQQDTLSQIKQFVSQSKQAAGAGDIERAHNLAEKAKLLSDELVK